MRRGALIAVLAVLAGLPALASPPTTSPRPLPNPVIAAAPAPTLAFVAAPAVQRPRARPETLAAAPRPEAPAAAQRPDMSAPGVQLRQAGIFAFLRPAPRPAAPEREIRAAVVTPPAKAPVASKKGALCGDPAIRGERLAPITARVKGCGIDQPVRVTSVAGVRLSQPATLDCAAAKALRKWVETGLEPVYGEGKVVELKIAAHYACRPRNNVKGAKISEHGRGRAIDIAGLTFADGKTQPVLRGFDKRMRKVHKAACGIFGTTLGPGSDGYHEDHMHFDVPTRARGPYCR